MNGSVHLAHDWYPAAVPRSVVLGEGSWLYSAFAFRHFRSRLPVAVRIGRATGVYVTSFFDLGPAGQVIIGDYSTLVGVIIATNRRVSIGSYCFLAHEVVIADRFAATPPRDEAGDAPDLLANDDAGVALGDDVWVGAGAVLLGGARLGNGAVVGAGTVVDFEVPPNAIVAGNPARIVGKSTDG